jgi:hypothetical protein
LLAITKSVHSPVLDCFFEKSFLVALSIWTLLPFFEEFTYSLGIRSEEIVSNLPICFLLLYQIYILKKLLLIYFAGFKLANSLISIRYQISNSFLLMFKFILKIKERNIFPNTYRPQLNKSVHFIQNFIPISLGSLLSIIIHNQSFKVFLQILIVYFVIVEDRLN